MAQPLRSAPRGASRRVRAGRSDPKLSVVARRRRWPAVFGGVAFTIVIAGMLAAAVFHTQLAERQFEIDRLERGVAEEKARFDELRNERAQLRSPQRIADAAAELGMQPGQTGRFIDVDPHDLARQVAAAGVVVEVERVIVSDDPLAQFRDVKAVSAGQP
ncbi:MAG: hypothetical protein AAFP84_09195 [Actinomycetota bacterium]